MILPKEHLLAGVSDVFNAVMVKGDNVGDVVFVGRGAGKLPTASAVVADVIDAAKHLNARKYIFWSGNEAGHISDYRLANARLLLRYRGGDTAQMAAVFGEVEMVTVPNAPADEIAFITPSLPLCELEEKMNAIADMTLVSKLRLF